jgi:hypothetical protein
VVDLELRGRHALLPTPKIKVPQAKKPELEVLMPQLLSEWPSGAES